MNINGLWKKMDETVRETFNNQIKAYDDDSMMYHFYGYGYAELIFLTKMKRKKRRE